MASPSISPHHSSSSTTVFGLVSETANGVKWQVAGRSLSAPYTVELNRKIDPNATANDHIVLKVSRTEKNTTTSKSATGSVSVDISVPKDNTILTTAELVKMAEIAASLINDYSASAATTTNATAFIEGSDI